MSGQRTPVLHHLLWDLVPSWWTFVGLLLFRGLFVGVVFFYVANRLMSDCSVNLLRARRHAYIAPLAIDVS